MGAHGFEHGDDIGVALAGQDSAAIDKHTGTVEPCQADQATGHVLVAPPDRHEPIKAFAAGHRLDGVGDHLPGHQRILHPLGAIGDAIGDSDGIEDHPFTTGIVSAFTGPLCQFADMAVAGRHLAPGGSNADLGFLEILIGKPHRPQHGPASRLARAVHHLGGMTSAWVVLGITHNLSLSAVGGSAWRHW